MLARNNEGTGLLVDQGRKHLGMVLFYPDEEPKELAGAILEKPINAPQIETGTKDAPQIITDSSKAGT